MNKQLVIGAVFGGLAITTIAAVAGYRTEDTMTVSVPRQECHDELVTLARPAKDSVQIAGIIAGAVVGGVIRHPIGSTDGKQYAAAGSTIAGGILGDEIQDGTQEPTIYQELKLVCRTVI